MSEFDRKAEFERKGAQPVIATVASGLERNGKDAARRHIKLLAGDANARMHFALVHQRDASAPARLLDGPLDAHWDAILAAGLKGYAAFVVVNEGGRSEGTIRRIRALFLEGRGVPLPTVWHSQPSFVVLGDRSQWCAYWTVKAFSVDNFRPAQAKLASLYDMEIRPNTLARAMPLAGTRWPLDATLYEEIALVEWFHRPQK
jgi:hypothetical protein